MDGLFAGQWLHKGFPVDGLHAEFADYLTTDSQVCPQVEIPDQVIPASQFVFGIIHSSEKSEAQEDVGVDEDASGHRHHTSPRAVQKARS